MEFVNYYNLTVEQVKEEVKILNMDNIKKFPVYFGAVENFYSMWQRFGPEAARTMMIPYVWQGKCPLPSEHFGT